MRMFRVVRHGNTQAIGEQELALIAKVERKKKREQAPALHMDLPGEYSTRIGNGSQGKRWFGWQLGWKCLQVERFRLQSRPTWQSARLEKRERGDPNTGRGKRGGRLARSCRRTPLR